MPPRCWTPKESKSWPASFLVSRCRVRPAEPAIPGWFGPLTARSDRIDTTGPHQGARQIAARFKK
uniref:Uncharacterized protein n=1 Tax=Arundo donax TaxID=35708 RepID=A0A0A9BJT8_ARUDO